MPCIFILPDSAWFYPIASDGHALAQAGCRRRSCLRGDDALGCGVRFSVTTSSGPEAGPTGCTYRRAGLRSDDALGRGVRFSVTTSSGPEAGPTGCTYRRAGLRRDDAPGCGVRFSVTMSSDQEAGPTGCAYRRAGRQRDDALRRGLVSGFVVQWPPSEQPGLLP